MIFNRGRRKGKKTGKFIRSMGSPLCDRESQECLRQVMELEGVKMLSQDLMNGSSFTLKDPEEKIISDNIIKVSAAN